MNESTASNDNLELLKDVTVVELAAGVAAPYTSRKLAELGADVIKVEAPDEGDPVRSWGCDPDESASHGSRFAFLNANKRSLTLDHARERGREVLARLLERANVLVTDRTRADFPFDDPETVVADKNVIATSITPFGAVGPRADQQGHPINCDALAGVQIAIGKPDREPLALPAEIGAIQGGIHGACSILMMLFLEEATGARPQYVDVAVADVLATYTMTNAAGYIYYEGVDWERAGHRANGSGGPYPYTILPCADGAVCLICRSTTEWERFLDAMGSPDWATKERYSDRIAMGKDYPDEVDEKIQPWLAKHTKEELFDIAQEYGFAMAAVRTVDEAIEEPHLSDREFFDRVEDPSIGEVQLPGLPFEFSAGSLAGVTDPAPELGVDSASVLEELGYDSTEYESLRQAGVV